MSCKTAYCPLSRTRGSRFKARDASFHQKSPPRPCATCCCASISRPIDVFDGCREHLGKYPPLGTIATVSYLCRVVGGNMLLLCYMLVPDPVTAVFFAKRAPVDAAARRKNIVVVGAGRMGAIRAKNVHCSPFLEVSALRPFRSPGDRC